jgi:3-hydroxypropanoate dehydrogenase
MTPHAPLDDAALDQLFRTARTYSAFTGRPVEDATLRAILDLARWGPTASNGCPARFVFVRSTEGRALLEPALSAGTHDKTMKAPCVVIIAYDLRFFDQFPTLAPHVDGEAAFGAKPEAAQTVAFRNGSLEAAYFILAARALGLDCGPMSGFNNAKVDDAFFAGTSWRSNILCNLGYGDPATLRPRGARLAFDDWARFA